MISYYYGTFFKSGVIMKRKQVAGGQQSDAKKLRRQLVSIKDVPLSDTVRALQEVDKRLEPDIRASLDKAIGKLTDRPRRPCDDQHARWCLRFPFEDKQGRRRQPDWGVSNDNSCFICNEHRKTMEEVVKDIIKENSDNNGRILADVEIDAEVFDTKQPLISNDNNGNWNWVMESEQTQRGLWIRMALKEHKLVGGLSFENIVVLPISIGFLEFDWLRITDSAIEKLPCSIGATKLKSLTLENCGQLQWLTECIGDLTSLTELKLNNCYSLVSLPQRIGECKSLNSLYVNFDGLNTTALESLPDSIGDLKELTELDLKYCSALVSLPKRIGECKSLTSLNLSGDAWHKMALESLPDSIGDLKSLTKLDLRWCTKLTSLPERFGKLNLTTLGLGRTPLDGAEETYAILGKISTLTYLDLSRSTIESLPESIGALKSLTTLNLYQCYGLESLPDSIGDLTSLTKLNLIDCTSLKSLPDRFGECKSLTSLNLKDCRSLDSLPDSIGECTALKTLNLDVSFGLVSLPKTIGDLTSLTELKIRNYVKLVSIPDLSRLPNLKIVEVTNCPSVPFIPLPVGMWKRGSPVLSFYT